MSLTATRETLFIPGPVELHPAVVAAAGQPMISHRGAAFAQMHDRIIATLQALFGTTSDVVLLGASGTGALEAAIGSLVAPGDRVLIVKTGVFATRHGEIAEAAGARVDYLEAPAGEPIDYAILAAHLRASASGDVRAIVVTHNDTSTGVRLDMDAVRAAIGEHPAFLIVDGVSGFGASDYAMDRWQADAIAAASQKAVAAPPGLGMLALSERAWSYAEKRERRLPFYCDAAKAREFARKGQLAWTPPIPTFFALSRALELYEEEGALNVWKRHATYASRIRSEAVRLGMKPFSREDAHSVTVVTLRPPAGIDAEALRAVIRHGGYLVGGGQREFSGKVIRIGTMGYLTPRDIEGVLGCLRSGLAAQKAS